MLLLERESQRRSVAGYLAEAAQGHGRLVFVSGEAGVGKSAFVGEVLQDAAGDARVAVGYCDGVATPAPLGPLHEMLADLPEQVWPDGAPRHEVFVRLVAGLTDPGLGEPGPPSLLVFEDVHWADEATFDLLRYLARRVHRCRALVLVTYRPEDAPAPNPLRGLLGDTATATGVRRLDLSPLSVDAVRVLAAGTGSGPRDVEELYRVSGGNPFFVTEILASAGAAVPVTVRDAVLARLARLGSAASGTAQLVALAGPRAPLPVVERLLDGDLQALDGLLDRDVLRVVDGEVMFRHDLAREAVAADLSPFRRVAVHRAILAALVELGQDGGPDQVARAAHHADAARDPAAVLRYAPRAAQAAAQLGAHREAVLQYRRTLRHAGSLDDRERADLLGRLAYECYLTDLIDDALAARREALAIWVALGEAVRVGDTHRWLSRLSWFAGRNADADAHADSAVRALEGSGSIELAMAYSNAAQLRMLARDLPGTRVWAARTFELLDRLPESEQRTEVLVHVSNNLGTAELGNGDPVRGAALLGDSLERARAVELHEHAARAYCNLVATSVTQHCWADATAQLAAGLEYCADRDLDSWWSYLTGWRALLLLGRGDPAAALGCANEVLRRAGTAPVSRIGPLVVLALALARTQARAGDDWSPALTQALELAWETGESQRVALAVAAACETAWLSDREGEIGPLAARARPLVGPQSDPWLRGMIATWLAADDVDAAELAPPYALQVQGRWEDAAGAWLALDSPHHAALALARSGERGAMARAASPVRRPARPRLRRPGPGRDAPPRLVAAARRPAGDPDRPAGPDLPGARGARPGRGRADRRRDRRAAGAVPAHRRAPRGGDLAKLGVASRHEAVTVATSG